MIHIVRLRNVEAIVFHRVNIEHLLRARRRFYLVRAFALASSDESYGTEARAQPSCLIYCILSLLLPKLILFLHRVLEAAHIAHLSLALPPREATHRTRRQEAARGGRLCDALWREKILVSADDSSEEARLRKAGLFALC